MNHALSGFAKDLSGAKYFEDAAELTLEMLLRLAAKTLAASQYGDQGGFLRGMLHLRPSGGYQGLVVLENGADRVTDVGVQGPEQVSLRSSLTAWRWVFQHGSTIAIDVTMGRARVVKSNHSAECWPIPDDDEVAEMDPGEQDALASRVALLERRVSHLCALPLRQPGGRIDGMISLEVACPSAINREFIWGECADALESFCDVAALSLLSLPRRPGEGLSKEVNALLPVVGKSMRGLMVNLRAFAMQEDTILLQGPTGSGKTRLARWCHEQSRRHLKPFASVELHTVPEDLQFAHLVGWKEGAFTSASRTQAGLVERAEGGSIFIDEIDKLSIEAQSNLLRLIEERRYSPLGDHKRERTADVRFIVGTNANLYQEVRAGRFREDLYYRINVLPVKVLPLRERADEIPLWARFMLKRTHQANRRSGTTELSANAEMALLECDWPGNLRQLDNVVRRAYSMALVEFGADAITILIRERHVESALRCEGQARSTTLLNALRHAAQAFVNEAISAARRGEPLRLGFTGTLQGTVIASALLSPGPLEGNLDAVFRLFGEEKMVRNRNHYRAATRELRRLEDLFVALGETPPSDLEILFRQFVKRRSLKDNR